MKHLLINLLAITSCVSSQFDPITNIVMTENNKLQKKYHLTPFGFGTIGPGGIKAYILEHDYYIESSVDEARLLLVHYVEDLKRMINHDFKSQNLHAEVDEHFFSISIGFKDYQGKRICKEGGLALISLNKGVVTYDQRLETEINYQTFHTETYQEAYRIAREKQND